MEAKVMCFLHDLQRAVATRDDEIVLDISGIE